MNNTEQQKSFTACYEDDEMSRGQKQNNGNFIKDF